MTSRPAAPYLALLAAVGIWSASFVFTKVAVTEAAPMACAVARFTLATAALLAAHVALRRRFRLPRDTWRPVVWAAMTGTVGTFALENTALLYTTAGNAAMFSAASPLLTMAGAVVLLRERLTLRQVAGAAIACAGMVALIGPEVGTTGPGDLLMAVVLVLGTAYGLQAKQLASQLPALTALTGMFLVGTAGLVPFAIAEAVILGPPLLPATATAWGAIAYLGLLASGVAYLLWQWAMARVPVSTAGLFLYLMPVGTLALGALWLGEPLGPWRAFLALVILAGVYLAVEALAAPDAGTPAGGGPTPTPREVPCGTEAAV